MSGPDQRDCVTWVDSDTGPVLFHYAEGFRYERLPVGTRIVWPPKPLPALADPDRVIGDALDHPLGSEPFDALLRPGMKVTIAFDDISLPLPPMRTPDIRERVIRILLERLARKGVTDVHLICAVSLHRHMTGPELRRILGRRIFEAFWPDRLYNHDAEDRPNIVTLDRTEAGEVVELNRRAVESDLLVYVNINLVAMDGGHKSVPVGLTTYRSLRHHHNVHALRHSRSFMDPPNSALHASCARMGAVVEKAVRIFKIETTVNNASLPSWLGYLGRRKDEWGFVDHATRWLNQTSTSLLPRRMNRFIFRHIHAPYGLLSVTAGATEPVHARTLEHVYAQQAVPVEGQADIVVIGVPYICPYNVNSILNPVLVHCLALGYFFNLYRGRPLVRPGGSYVLVHPLDADFHPGHHPSYIDFFWQVLTCTRDPRKLEEQFEEEFATSPRYIELYRRRGAYHGVHPFYMWYWGAHAMEHLGEVIVAHPRDCLAAEVLGWKCAGSVAEAIAMARSRLGPQATVTNFQIPPLVLTDVA